MAGQVAAGDNLAKSTADVGKISGMTNRIVQVTKHMARGAAGQLVVPAQAGVSVQDILDLQKTLPDIHGPGTYRFEVSELGGTDKDTWVVRLGKEVEGMMGNVTSLPGVPASMPTEGTTQLGPGWFYNADLGTLYTPWKQVYNWRPDQPLPTQPGMAPPQPVFGAPFGSSFATPIGGVPGWGQFPAADDGRTKALEAQNDALLQRLNDSERQREREETRALFVKMQEETNRRFEQLIASLRPSGPTEAEQRLAQELAEQRRRQEDQAREERLRAEMRAQQEQFQAMLRELMGNKSDPALTMLTQLMQASQAAQTETVRAVTSSTQAQLSSVERNVMSPIQIIEMLRASKDTTAAGEMNRAQLEMFKSVFDMAQGLLKMQAEMASAGDAPAWVGLAQQGLDRIGAVAQAYAQSKAQQPQVQQPQQAEYTPPMRQRPRPRQAQQVPTAPQASAVPAPAPERVMPTREPTAAELRDAAAAAVFKTAATPAAVAPAPPAPAPATPDAVIPPPVVGEPKRRRARREQQQPDLQAATAEEVRAITRDMDDPTFFGSALSQIGKLRESVTSENLRPDQVAGAVLFSRQYFTAFGELPPALEVLNAGHYIILVERLLPLVASEYRAAVVEQLRLQVSKEAELLEEDDPGVEDETGGMGDESEEDEAVAG